MSLRFDSSPLRGPAAIALISGVSITTIGVKPCLAFPPARLRSVKPLVETQRAKKKWVAARERTTLIFGDRVRTGPRGTTDIVFNNGARLALRANTHIQVTEPRSPNKPLIVRVFGALGEVFIKTKGPVEVRTAAGIAAAQNCSFSVRLDAEDQSVLTVRDGKVRFFSDFDEENGVEKNGIDVEAGEQSRAQVGSGPTEPTRVDVSGELSWTNEVGGLPLPFELPPMSGPVTGGPEAVALNAAKADLQAGNARGAQARFRELLNSPFADEARAGLALALLSNEQRDEARQVADGATTPLATGVRALLLLEDGDAVAARDLLLPLASEPAVPFQVVSLLALAQIQIGDAAQALQTAARAVQLAPQSAGATATLALAQFYGRAANKTVLRTARQALELNPFSPLALLAVGRIEAARGNLDEARQAFEQVVALDPNLPGVQRDLGAIEAALDRLPRAELAYRAAIAASPNDARSLAGLGTVLLQRGERTEALANLDQAARIAPNDPFVRAQSANFLVDNGDLEEAAREGDFLLAQQDGTPAVPDDTILNSNDPSRGALFVRLSEAELFRGKLNEAQRYASAAVRLLPDSSLAQYQLGRVFLEQGRTTQAQSRFLLATVLDPNAPRPRYALGYTQELIAQGGDVARPLGQIQAAREGASNVALVLQNLSTPGSAQRFQAIAQDPTAVRAATRSYGDWQLDGRLGTNDTASGGISYLHESGDRRSLTAASVSRDTTDGARQGSGSQQTRASITLGTKAKNSPSSIFGFASYNRTNPVKDREFDQPVPTGTSRFEQPLVVVGGNIAGGRNDRTRFLFQAGRTDSDSLFSNRSLRNEYDTIHGEVRHDRKLGDKWYFSAGGSVGQGRSDILSVINFATDPPSGFSTQVNFIAQNYVAYARAAYTPSARLKLEGELKLRSSNLNNVVSSRFEPNGSPFPPPPPLANPQQGELLPSFIATYRSGQSTLLRFRSRRLLGGIEDFELLSPNDLFGFDFTNDAPQLDFGQRGRSYEFEVNHTFSNSSFFRLGLFRIDEATGARSDSGEGYNFSRLQGLRVGYEGLLNRRTSFFTSATWNGSRAAAQNLVTGGTYATSTISGLPDYSAEIGVQYLDDNGFFFQPSLAYLGPRSRARFDLKDARQRLGGLPLVNLRVGKRFGLKSSFYIEASNIFDRSYTLAVGGFERLQSGRQISVGATFRF